MPTHNNRRAVFDQATTRLDQLREPPTMPATLADAHAEIARLRAELAALRHPF